jgi:hypothetical protein
MKLWAIVAVIVLAGIGAGMLVMAFLLTVQVIGPHARRFRLGVS